MFILPSPLSPPAQREAVNGELHEVSVHVARGDEGELAEVRQCPLGRRGDHKGVRRSHAAVVRAVARCRGCTLYT